jgi:hypothetical protein
MGAVIDHDHLSLADLLGPEYDRKGMKWYGGLTDPSDVVRFKMLDDDREVYYSGRMDRATYEMDEDTPGSAYNLLEWGTADSGCTDILFRADDLPEATVTQHRAIGCVRKISGNEWVQIYG